MSPRLFAGQRNIGALAGRPQREQITQQPKAVATPEDSLAHALVVVAKTVAKPRSFLTVCIDYPGRSAGGSPIR